MDDEDVRFLRVHVSRLRRKVHVLRQDVDELKEAMQALVPRPGEPGCNGSGTGGQSPA